MPAPHVDDAARLRSTYVAYEASSGRDRAWSRGNSGNRLIVEGGFAALWEALEASTALPVNERRVLDVGCGTGPFLAFLAERGVPADMLHGVDLLEAHTAAARERVPGADVRAGDARSLPFADSSVDAAVMSLLLSSLRARETRARVAAEVLRVLRPGGVVLSWDARMPNPGNRNVRAVSRRELRALFPGCELTLRRLTLLPPLARRLGPWAPTLYPALEALPVLRSHLLAIVRPA